MAALPLTGPSSCRRREHLGSITCFHLTLTTSDGACRSLMASGSPPTSNSSTQASLHPAGLVWGLQEQFGRRQTAHAHLPGRPFHSPSACITLLSLPVHQSLHTADVGKQTMLEQMLRSTPSPRPTSTSESKEFRPFPLKPYACHPAPAGLCLLSQDPALDWRRKAA